jgi:hypothetical protein
LVETLKKYAKALVGAAGVILAAVLVAFVGDGSMNMNEFVNVVVLGTGTVSLAIAPNTPGAKYVKALLAAVSAAAVVLISVYTGGISPTEWVQIAVAAGTAAGVWKVPNQGDQFDKYRSKFL